MLSKHYEQIKYLVYLQSKQVIGWRSWDRTFYKTGSTLQDFSLSLLAEKMKLTLLEWQAKIKRSISFVLCPLPAPKNDFKVTQDYALC